MKAFIASAVLLSCSSVASAQAPLASSDKGWTAFFVRGECMMGRSVDAQTESAAPDSGIAVSIVWRPDDKSPPAAGQMILSVGPFENRKPVKEPARSIGILAGTKQWMLTSEPKYGTHYILGQQADEVRSSFLTDGVTIEVTRADGSSQSFKVSSKWFKVANATFNACMTALRTEKP